MRVAAQISKKLLQTDRQILDVCFCNTMIERTMERRTTHEARKRRQEAQIGRPPKLTGEDMLLIARLHKRGLKSRTIARMLSTPERPIHYSTVSRWIKRAATPPEETRMALASLRAQAIESWSLAMTRGARDGRHAPSKDLLVATGDISADRPVDRLVILVGNGQTAVGTLPVIEARAPLTDLLNPAAPIVDADPVDPS